MKIIFFLLLGLLSVFSIGVANDLAIDHDGNLTLGTSNTDANLEVTGASAEDAIMGTASGTGAAAIYGIRSDTGNYGILGYDSYGVFGYSSDGYAGYFDGSVWVTGNITLEGTLTGYTETDPVFSVWDKSTGIFITESQITDLNHFSSSDETDPLVNTLGKATLDCSSGQIVKKSSTTWICADESVGSIWNQSDSDIYYNSGNVGVGVTNPTQKLDIDGYVKGQGLCIGDDCRTGWAGEGVGGAMITGDGNVGYCSNGSCQTFTVQGVNYNSWSDCGANECMVAGNGNVGYCSNGSCQTFTVQGVTTFSYVFCRASGCMVTGSGAGTEGNVGYCSNGSCQTFHVQGVEEWSNMMCGSDGCMVAGGGAGTEDNVGYCSNGSCQSIHVHGVNDGSSIACGSNGCIIAGGGAGTEDNVGYCSNGSCQTFHVPGVQASSHTSSFMQ